jgi:signal transduction histidine kinase
VVGPSRRIAIAAGRLGDGDLGTRVEVVGPPELVSIATAFNVLADRIRELLAAEREEVADLSHRLRTPLTAARLQVERMVDSPEREAILAKIDGLGLAVNDLISEARKPADREIGECDVVAVARSRATFWKVLADEQSREMAVDIGDEPGMVRSSTAQAGAAIDALIGNVFAHTDPGVGFGIAIRLANGLAEIEVADIGRGFPEDFDPGRRGISGGDSSGLGLDIARRFADAAGGEMIMGTSTVGGARVTLEIPISRETSNTVRH